MEKEGLDRNEIFSKAVRAGKRTYFFDVKTTRKDELYLTVTESKKKYDPNGRYHFEKFKIFLYKEDFDKFAEGLIESINFIKSKQSDDANEDDFQNTKITKKSTILNEKTDDSLSIHSNDFTDVDFDDLDKK